MDEEKYKFLFLPHCLVENIRDRIKEEAKKRGYEVYILKGGSILKKIFENYSPSNIKKIIGVACQKEIGLAKESLTEINIPIEKIFSVELSCDGCTNTEVNLENVLKVL